MRKLTKKQRSAVVTRALGTEDQDNEIFLRKVKERMDKCASVALHGFRRAW